LNRRVGGKSHEGVVGIPGTTGGNLGCVGWGGAYPAEHHNHRVWETASDWAVSIPGDREIIRGGDLN